MVESWYDSGVRLRDEEAAAAPEAAPYVPQTTSIAGKASDAAIVGALQYGPAIIGIAVLLFIVVPGAGKFLNIAAENADLYSPLVDPSQLPTK